MTYKNFKKLIIKSYNDNEKNKIAKISDRFADFHNLNKDDTYDYALNIIKDYKILVLKNNYCSKLTII